MLPIGVNPGIAMPERSGSLNEGGLNMLQLTGNPNGTEPARHGVARICLILAVAAYGAVVVQNVTGMLRDIVRHPVIVLAADRPSR
jgi:hypothetical protein